MDVAAMPVLQIILVAILFLSIMVEVKTGGMGAGLMLGLVAAAVFFGSQYVKGIASVYQIGIFLMGVFCLVAELLMPTIGLLAGVGLAVMLYSVALALGGDVAALYVILAALLLALAGFILIVSRLPSSGLWHKVVLRDSSASEYGYTSSAGFDSFLGQEGQALTELRPAGTAQVGGNPIDVVSEGMFIEKGSAVKVVGVHGNRVIVRKI